MHGHARREPLRRRVEKDLASIAFAQLAEAYRRAGDYREAVRVGRAGLAHHPTYLSARVTLGRALTELGDYAAARRELESVVGVAPDNLAAIRGLADLHLRDYEGESEAGAAGPAAVAPALGALERWLAAIEADQAGVDRQGDRLAP